MKIERGSIVVDFNSKCYRVNSIKDDGKLVCMPIVGEQSEPDVFLVSDIFCTIMSIVGHSDPVLDAICCEGGKVKTSVTSIADVFYLFDSSLDLSMQEAFNLIAGVYREMHERIDFLAESYSWPDKTIGTVVDNNVPEFRAKLSAAGIMNLRKAK